MANPIVVVNVSQTNAPVPSALQQTGALVTQGGTTAQSSSLTSYATLASLVAVLAPSKNLSTLTWAGSVVTGTTTAPHGWTNGDAVLATIAGATPVGYNGTFTITITGASTFTYPLVSNPGANTVPGTVTLQAVAELNAMVTTYFAQPGVPAINVLELGESTVANGVTAFNTYLTNNPPGFLGVPGLAPPSVYSYLVPREWDNNGAFIAVTNNYAANNSKIYFWVRTTYANRVVYAGTKSVVCMIEANDPGLTTLAALPATEYSEAAPFGVTLAYSPSSTVKVPPLQYAFLQGVTPVGIPGNQTQVGNLATANVSFAAYASEGGLSNRMLQGGKNADGNPFGYWYSADWMQINLDMALSNEVINGSNNPLAPLYYDQPGINRLQNRAIQVARQGVSYGLATGQVVSTQLPIGSFLSNFSNGQYAGQIVINAEPFLVYNQENPNDYASGRYAGIACVWRPSRGFNQIVFLLNVTNLITP